MAPPAGTLRVGRYFLALGVLFAVLYALVFLPGQSHAPKLGLDLVGGAQVVLQASTSTGTAPSADAMNEARSIIEQRVNGRGVSNSQVAIEGADRITVTVPGKRADDITDIGKTALLEFRPVLAGPFATAPVATPSASPSASGAASGSASVPAGAGASAAPATGTASSGAPTTAASNASPQGAGARPLAAAPSTTPAAASSPAAASPATSSAAAPASPSAAATPPVSAPASAPPTAAPTVPGASAVTTSQFAAFASQYGSVPGVRTLSEAQARALIAYRCGKDQPATDPKAPIVTCDQRGTQKYLLDKVLFPGTEVAGATAVAPGTNNVQWTVQLKLKSSGQNTWSAYTQAHHNPDSTGNTPDTTPADFVAFTLDGTVITAPNINSTITGDTTITGQFTEASATDLANSLKYGALPLSFQELTSQTVSATLGTAQLKAGLLAGGIGLVLVVVYSLIYYRGLGLVTLASLVVSGGVVYAALVILGRQIGFTLTLAGVAGFIVAVGITADSFVVFFERIKDEVHEGRSMRVAVPRAWIRARRTIISADIVSLLAALVLYFIAAGDVRGFAFTLGLSTLIDLVVVFWFTHPTVSLLSRSPAFGSPRFTGLSAVRAGVVPGGGARATRPAARPAAGPRRAATAGSATTGTPADGRGRSSVAVLDRDDAATGADVADGTDVAPAGGGVADRPGNDADVTPTADAAARPVDATALDRGGAAADDAVPDGGAATPGPTEESHGASAVGTSAAERAAARRARLRGRGTDGGNGQ